MFCWVGVSPSIRLHWVSTGPVLEADDREGGLPGQIFIELPGRLRPPLSHGGPEGAQAVQRLGVAVLAVVEGAAGGQEGGEITVGGEPHLPQIQVELPRVRA